MVGAVRLERTVFRLKVGGFTTKLYTHIGGKGETCTHIGGFSVHCIDCLCYRSKLENGVRFALTNKRVAVAAVNCFGTHPNKKTPKTSLRCLL